MKGKVCKAGAGAHRQGLALNGALVAHVQFAESTRTKRDAWWRTALFRGVNGSHGRDAWWRMILFAELSSGGAQCQTWA